MTKFMVILIARARHVQMLYALNCPDFHFECRTFSMYILHFKQSQWPICMERRSTHTHTGENSLLNYIYIGVVIEIKCVNIPFLLQLKTRAIP